MDVRRVLLTLLALALSMWAHLLTPSRVAAQIGGPVNGQVVQFGFDNYYRPGSWVPVKVRISSQTAQYELRITQRDADGDRVLFSRPIVVTGDAANGEGQQQFWAYFQVEAMDGGLPETDSVDLAQRLRITVHSTDGREIATVSMGRQMPRKLDTSLNIGGGKTKGNRLILLVNGTGTNTKLFAEPSRVLGTLENYIFLSVRTDQLPQSSLGLDMVDAVVWCTSLPEEISRDPARLAMLREWVRTGGHLVIATPTQWQQLELFGDLMPVTIQGIDPTPDVPGLVRVNGNVQFVAQDIPVRVARAVAKPGAYVELTTNPQAEPPTIADQPLIVRLPYGLGCVTWLAVDLTDPALTRESAPWLSLWPRILGFGDTPRFRPEQPPGQPAPGWVTRFSDTGPSNASDLGSSVLQGLSQSGTATALVGIAALFFIAYWIVAGPAMYYLLMLQNKSTWNWLGFAVLAMVATAITLGVVRLVLSGPPSITHYSIVRGQSLSGTSAPVTIAPATIAPVPGGVTSRFGLYVRQNTAMPLTLAPSDPSLSSYLIPYPQHPALRSSDEVTVAAPKDYVVKMPTEPASRVEQLEPYFRTTLKRFLARWWGAMPGANSVTISGNAVLVGPQIGEIEGQLQNLTGQNLRNVYFAFTMSLGGNQVDQLYYVPRWANADTIDLRKTLSPPTDVSERQVAVNNRPAANGRVLHGVYTPAMAEDSNVGWPAVWFGKDFRTRGIGLMTGHDDFGSTTPTSVPVLSLFSRLPTMVNRGVGADIERNRVELRRSGVRDFDISNAILAGNLVVIAQADNDDAPMPAPVQVNGRPVKSRGKIVYQFVIPLKRKWTGAATQPSN